MVANITPLLKWPCNVRSGDRRTIGIVSEATDAACKIRIVSFLKQLHVKLYILIKHYNPLSASFAGNKKNINTKWETQTHSISSNDSVSHFGLMNHWTNELYMSQPSNQ